MTKEVLEQYTHVKLEIKKLEERIERLEKQSAMIADTVQNGLQGKKKRISIVYGYDIRRANLLKKYKTQLEEFKIVLLEKQIEVEEFIEAISDSRIRLIFQLRYHENRMWYQIAQIMKYDSEDAPRKVHDRYLKKLEKI